jgi:Ca2+-binding EF-hand superfamily protein
VKKIGIMAGNDGGVDWSSINSALPVGSSQEDRARRKQMFHDFDPNGNGYLSLAEIDKSIRVVLNIDALFDAKPAIMRAFQIAKNSTVSKNPSVGTDYIELAEFKFFLVALRQYFEYWVAFTTIDQDDDKRIDRQEFHSQKALIESWVQHVEDMDAAFDNIDKNGGGIILFDEFCEWAINKSLDLLDDEELEGADFKAMKDALPEQDSAPTPSTPSAPSAPMNGPSKEVHVDWEQINNCLPISNSPEDKQRRKQMFHDFDPNGNGVLSLAEIDKGMIYPGSFVIFSIR